MSWSNPLARELVLTDGRVLRTLHDAAECLIASFPSVTHSPALKHASDVLMTAAETGKRKDVAAATDQVAIVLGQWKLLA